MLAEVYLELMGGRQAALALDATSGSYVPRKTAKTRPEPLPSRLSADTIARHAAFVKSIGAEGPWRDYVEDRGPYEAAPDNAD